LAPRFRSWLLDFETRAGVPGIFWSGNPAYEIRREIAPKARDVVIRKRTCSAFNSSDFEPYLPYGGISSLVIIGVTTNACIESTARDAADRGFSCVSSTTQRPTTTSRPRRIPQRCHFNFGRIATARDVIAAVNNRTAI